MRMHTLLAMMLSIAPALTIALATPAGTAGAAVDSPIFERVMTVDLKDPVILNVDVTKGDVTIAYNRDGQVTVHASARNAAGQYAPRDTFESLLTIEQHENQIIVHTKHGARVPEDAHISYRIDVPVRTQVTSTVSGIGNQIVMGISGPATITSGEGDIDARYISEGLLTARTGQGLISCTRVGHLDVETASGRITLMENGPSVAVVKHGAGRIEVGGARGSVHASTDKGELSIKAVPWDNWELTSNAGNIRIALPPKAKFDLDVTSNAGQISIERHDVAKADADNHHYRLSVNGGGKRIQAHTTSGSVSIE
jgi:DUF4097 and DUF4098 domain-containing protein YvlB